MKWYWAMFGLMLTGCGAAVSLTYTPPITFGVTLDMRALPQASTAPTSQAVKP